jgi:hypothetical protein
MSQKKNRDLMRKKKVIFLNFFQIGYKSCISNQKFLDFHFGILILSFQFFRLLFVA